MLQSKVLSCEKCKIHIEPANTASNSAFVMDQSRAIERVRELELELAQTKLAHVEAECRNQVNSHQSRIRVIIFYVF